jgi:hypothetical protein
MRSTGLVVALDCTLEPNSITDEGVSQMSTASDVGYTIRLVRTGDLLNSSNPPLSFRYVDGVIAGNHTVRTDPPADGYMPYSFYEPFQFQLAYSTAPTENDWYGQSALLATEFKQTLFKSGLNTNYAHHFFNTRLLQYNQDLYHLAEFYIWSNNRKINAASLFKYDPSTETSSMVKRFLELPIMSFDPQVDSYTEGLQTGSPDWCVYDGYLYIAYRTYESSSEASFIVIWRSNDDELVDWELASKTEISDTVSAPFNSYRLRMACGDGTIMVVSYAISSEDRELDPLTATLTSIDQRDMRVYLSSDGGATLRSRQSSFKSVRTGDGGTLSKVNSAVAVDNFFTPEFEAAVDIDSYNGMTVNFDLYFDKTMGSFVMLKAGGPAILNNGTYLMGIKTLDDDYFNWEVCLKQRLDLSMTGDTPDATDPWNPYDEDVNVATNEYEIQDLAVVPTDTTHTLVFTANRTADDHGVAAAHGIGVAQFSFVRNSQIPLGSFDTIYGYGGKYHPDYIFSSTMFNFDQNGLVGTGNAFEQPFTFTQPCATVYRGQIAASCKVDYGPDADGYGRNEMRFLALMNPWSNLNEVFGYEYAYSRMLEHITGWDFTATTDAGTGFYNYDYVTRGNHFTGTSFGYVSMNNPVGSPSVIDRASLSNPLFFKTKFQVKFNSFTTGSIDFMQIGAGTGSELRSIYLEAFGGGSGVIDVKLASGTVVASITGFDWDNEYEFMCGSSYNKDKANSIWVFYRVVGSNQWIPGMTATVSAAASAVTGHYKIGAIIRSASSAEVVIGNVQVSGLGAGYRKPFFNSKKDPQTWQEAGGFYTATPASYDDPSWAPTVKSFSPTVELMDGSIMKVGGSPEDIVTEVLWGYSKTLSRNSTRNVVDGVADNAYDFTTFYNKSAGSPRCVCYKTETASTPLHTDEGELIVFENDYRSRVDAFSLININGIHCFEVIVGTYDPALDTWSGETVIPYSIPRIVLDVGSSSGRRLVATNKEFVQDQVKQFSVLVYDTVNQYYVDQLQVVENKDGLIELNKTIPSLTNRELHIMYQAASYRLDLSAWTTPPSHIGFRLLAPDDAPLKSVGQIVLGTYIDLTNEVSEVIVSEMAVDKNVKSKFGFAFMPRTYPGNVIEKMEMKVPDIATRSASFSKLKSILFKLYKDKAPFVVLQQENESENATYFGVLDNPTPKPDKYGHSFDFNVFTQNWRPRSLTRVTNEPPSLVIGAANQNPPASTSVAFTSTSADPEGGAVTMSWDFGDGSALSALDNPSHSYSTEGSYVVTATASDPDGGSTVRKLLIDVAKANTDHLWIEVNGGVGSPYAINTSYEVEVQLRDSNDVLVAHDSTTQIFVLESTVPFEIDLDRDATWNEFPEDFGPKAVAGGIAFFDIRSSSVGTYQLYVYDTFGHSAVVSVTFA